jgi:hypothetical protein
VTPSLVGCGLRGSGWVGSRRGTYWRWVDARVVLSCVWCGRSLVREVWVCCERSLCKVVDEVEYREWK